MTGLRDRLIGAWRLVSYIEVPTDGSPAYAPMTDAPEGLILYTPDGFVSAQLATPGRPAFASGDWFQGTAEEYEAEATGYIAYSGSYHVDEAAGTLTHSMHVSLFPNWEGQTQPRIVALDGDTLRLSTATPIMSGGREVHSRLEWRRATAATNHQGDR